MTVQKAEDVKDTALKLNEIRAQHPEDYFYLKGWIHCLLQKSKSDDSHQRNPTNASEQTGAFAQLSFKDFAV